MACLGLGDGSDGIFVGVAGTSDGRLGDVFDVAAVWARIPGAESVLDGASGVPGVTAMLAVRTLALTSSEEVVAFDAVGDGTYLVGAAGIVVVGAGIGVGLVIGVVEADRSLAGHIFRAFGVRLLLT